MGEPPLGDLASYERDRFELAAVKQRCARGELSLLGIRFRADRLVPDERFAMLKEQLGSAFEAIPLQRSALQAGLTD